MKRNYQKELEETLQKLQAEGKRPILVLHCCCAPCSTYVLKYLAQYFIIKILFSQYFSERRILPPIG